MQTNKTHQQDNQTKMGNESSPLASIPPSAYMTAASQHAICFSQHAGKDEAGEMKNTITAA